MKDIRKTLEDYTKWLDKKSIFNIPNRVVSEYLEYLDYTQPVNETSEESGEEMTAEEYLRKNTEYKKEEYDVFHISDIAKFMEDYHKMKSNQSL